MSGQVWEFSGAFTFHGSQQLFPGMGNTVEEAIRDGLAAGHRIDVRLNGYHYERTLTGQEIVSIEPDTADNHKGEYLVIYRWEEQGAPQYRRLSVAVRRAPQSAAAEEVTR